MQQAQKRAMTYSGGMHALLLLIFILGLPSFLSAPDIEEPTAITVEILPISAMSNVKPSNRSKPKKEQAQEKAKPKEIIEKTLEDLKEEKEKPSPLVKTKDTPPPAPKVEEESDAPEEEKPKEEPKKIEKEQEEDPLDAILKGVRDTAAKDTKSAKAQEVADTSSASGNRSNSFDPNAPETIAIRDSIHNQIYLCWPMPAGARDAETLIVPLEIDYDKNGYPTKVVIAKSAMSKYRSDSFYRAAADTAVRSVKRCSPLKGLPPESYKTWQYVDMNFDPSKALR